MSEAEATTLETTFLTYVQTTQTEIARLQGSTNILQSVFGHDHVVLQLAREGLVAISAQLAVYAQPSQHSIDRGGTLAAGGTVLQNVGRGARDAAKIQVTRLWLDRSHQLRIAGLVHEASHGAATATEDTAYLDRWALGAMSGRDGLRNAPHYEAAMEILLGVRAGLTKPLAVTPPSGANDANVRSVLAVTDDNLTRARLLSGRMLHQLTTNMGDPAAPVSQYTFDVGGLLHCPFATGRAYPGGRATSADVELISILRTILNQAHDAVNLVTRVQLQAGLAGAEYVAGARELRLPSQAAALPEQQQSAMITAAITATLRVPNAWAGDVIGTAIDLLARPRATERLERMHLGTA